MKSNQFEKNMQQLEEIVQSLEEEDLSLEESVNKFEEGMKISKQCNEILEEAEKKITILLRENDDVKEEKFTQ